MDKPHTYKTRLQNLKEGDLGIVKGQSDIEVVQIVEVHDEPEIDPDSRVEFKWLTQKVNIEVIQEAEEEDTIFAKRCRERIRSNHRKQMALQLDNMLGVGFKNALAEEPKNALAEEPKSDLI